MKEREKSAPSILIKDGGFAGYLETISEVLGDSEIDTSKTDLTFDLQNSDSVEVSQLDDSGNPVVIGKIKTKLVSWGAANGLIDLEVKCEFSDVNNTLVDLGWDDLEEITIRPETIWKTHPKDQVFERPDLPVPGFENLSAMITPQEIQEHLDPEYDAEDGLSPEVTGDF